MQNNKYKFLTKTVRFYRNKFFQAFWITLNKLSIYGMNYHAAYHLINGELEVIKLIHKNFGPHPIIIDAGAYVGGYATSLLEIIKEPKQLYLFEPLKPNFNALQENVSESPNLSLINKGLSNAPENLNMHFSTALDSTASIYDNINGNILTEWAEFITLDDFMDQNNIRSVDFLKLDTEGHELHILEGCLHALTNKKIKAIQFEFGPYNIQSKTFFRDFYDLLCPEYQIFRIVNNGIFELKNYSTYLEKFITSNYLAVLKDCNFIY